MLMCLHGFFHEILHHADCLVLHGIDGIVESRRNLLHTLRIALNHTVHISTLPVKNTFRMFTEFLIHTL